MLILRLTFYDLVHFHSTHTVRHITLLILILIINLGTSIRLTFYIHSTITLNLITILISYSTILISELALVFTYCINNR